MEWQKIEPTSAVWRVCRCGGPALSHHRWGNLKRNSIKTEFNTEIKEFWYSKSLAKGDGMDAPGEGNRWALRFTIRKCKNKFQTLPNKIVKWCTDRTGHWCPVIQVTKSNQNKLHWWAWATGAGEHCFFRSCSFLVGRCECAGSQLPFGCFNLVFLLFW